MVAAVDRGNYPLAFFDPPAEGQMHGWFPPVVAVIGSKRVYGWEAIAVQDQPGGPLLRSPKRLPRGIQLPENGQPALSPDRIYKPFHNIGHFRYLECSRLDDRGQRVGEITNWEQIQFPFDPELENCVDLSSIPAQAMASGYGLSTREEYSYDANGSIRVRISSQPAGNEREYVIGQLKSK